MDTSFLPTDSAAYPSFTEGQGEADGDPTTEFENIVQDYTVGNPAGTIEHMDDIAPHDNTSGTLSTPYGTDSVDPKNLIQVPELTNEHMELEQGRTAIDIIRRMVHERKGLNVRVLNPDILTTGSITLPVGSQPYLILGSDWSRCKVRFGVKANLFAVPTDIFNNVAVLDTVAHASTPFQVDNMANKSLLLKSTLDQAGNFVIQWAPNQPGNAIPTVWSTVSGNIANAGAGATNVFTPALQTTFAMTGGWYRILFTASVAPTTGNVTAFLNSPLINPVDVAYMGRSQAEANAVNGYALYNDYVCEANDDIYVGPGASNVDTITVFWAVERFGANA